MWTYKKNWKQWQPVTFISLQLTVKVDKAEVLLVIMTLLHNVTVSQEGPGPGPETEADNRSSAITNFIRYIIIFYFDMSKCFMWKKDTGWLNLLKTNKSKCKVVPCF